MAVALEVGWGNGELGSSYIRMSKKRTWGEDHQKQLEMMLGRPFGAFEEAENDHTNLKHTLDLLGGTSSTISNKIMDEQHQHDEFLELGADVPLPNGWEKRLDLKSGMVYFTNVNTGKSTYEDPRKLDRVTSPTRSLLQCHHPSPTLGSSSCHISLELLQSEKIGCKQQQQQQEQVIPEVLKIQVDKKPQIVDDLNKKFEATNVDLELNLTPVPSDTCPKWLLPKTPQQQQHIHVAKEHLCPDSRAMVTLIGCKRCLMYVMISRDDPRCPKCGSSMVVDFPIAKRPRFDLEL